MQAAALASTGLPAADQPPGLEAAGALSLQRQQSKEASFADRMLTAAADLGRRTREGSAAAYRSALENLRRLGSNERTVVVS